MALPASSSEYATNADSSPKTSSSCTTTSSDICSSYDDPNVCIVRTDAPVTTFAEMIGSTIRGLVINNSGADGIKIEVGADGNTIEGNYIGTNVAGNASAANADDGIEVDSDNNVIRNNLISGNTDVGLLLHGGDGNLVIGNLIGTDQDTFTVGDLMVLDPTLVGRSDLDSTMVVHTRTS